MRARLLSGRPRAGAPGEQDAQQAHRHHAREPAPGRVARAQLRADRRVAAAPAKQENRLSWLSPFCWHARRPALLRRRASCKQGRRSHSNVFFACDCALVAMSPRSLREM